MKLYEIFRIKKSNILAEGGSMPGVGDIHISEIGPTLDRLQNILKIDLHNNTLGSVGKRQFSGDIDIALHIEPEDIPSFVKKLETIPEIMDISKSSVIMTKVKIENYDPDKSSNGKRTGFVQVDFMPGDPGWLKTYYHSPSEKESKYKGVFRNVMMATIAAVYDRQDSEEKLEDGRSLESLRYLWSPRDGLVKVKRTPTPRKSGDGYTKANTDEIVAGPWKTPDDIIKVLNLGDTKALNSYERITSCHTLCQSPVGHRPRKKGGRSGSG